MERARSLLYRLPLVKHLGIQLLVGFVISLLCIVVFAILASEIATQTGIVPIDFALADALHTQMTPFAIDAYRLITLIGNQGLWIIGTVVGVYFLLRKQWLHLTVWLIGLVGGNLLSNVLKDVFNRQRPVFSNPYSTENTFGFPSGHAMMTLIGFGLITYFLWDVARKRWVRFVIVLAAILVILLVGLSRLTLGVHYLSDVIAGYMVGGVWLSACITSLITIKRRKRAGDPDAQEKTGIAPTP